MREMSNLLGEDWDSSKLNSHTSRCKRSECKCESEELMREMPNFLVEDLKMLD